MKATKENPQVSYSQILLKNISFRLLTESGIYFSPKIPCKLATESANRADKLREATSSGLRFSKVSGHWESNPNYKTPSLAYYHYTMARKKSLSARFSLLFQNAVQIHIVENLFSHQTVRNKFIFPKPDRDFPLCLFGAV